MEGAGEGCGFFCSLKLPYLSTMSQLFCDQIIVVLEQTNLLGFILGGKSFHKYFKDCEIIF